MFIQTIENRDIDHIEFAGNRICLIEKDNELFVPLKPICTALELDWGSQFRNLQEDIVLNSTVVTMTIVARDEKQREMICIPLSYLNGWLFRINPARYEGDRRERIIKYQKECYQALFNHFYPNTREQLERKRIQAKGKRLDLSMIKSDLNIRKTFLAMEKQADEEAMRIFQGAGSIEDLDPCPKLQEMTQKALKKLNKDSLFPKGQEG